MLSRETGFGLVDRDMVFLVLLLRDFLRCEESCLACLALSILNDLAETLKELKS